MRYYHLFLAILLIGLSACGTSSTATRGSNYPKMYEEKPAVLLIMPPINKTTHVEAKDYFYTTLAWPLCEKGYYVVPPFLAMELMRNESAYDSEQFIDGPLDKFHEVFGADALLFTTIHKWSKAALLGTITVNIEYELISAKTHESLFKRRGDITIDLSSGSDSGTSSSSAWGVLGDLLSTTINTALTDKIEAARLCNNYVLRDLPLGKYSSRHDQDQDEPAGSANFKAEVRP